MVDAKFCIVKIDFKEKYVVISNFVEKSYNQMILRIGSNFIKFHITLEKNIENRFFYFKFTLKEFIKEIFD